MQTDKKILRQKAKQIRETLDIKTISKDIVQKIKLLDAFQAAKDVMIFYPLKNEINLLPLVSSEKSFYLPRVNGNIIECCAVKEESLCQDLKRGKYGIMEPTGECIKKPKLDIVFVPALGIDKQGHRLGYGGGYYDRFLKENKENILYTITPIPKELIFENVPNEDFDVVIDNYICS